MSRQLNLDELEELCDELGLPDEVLRLRRAQRRLVEAMTVAAAAAATFMRCRITGPADWDQKDPLVGFAQVGENKIHPALANFDTDGEFQEG